MFNSENATKHSPVTVTLIDGSVQTGNMILAMTSDLPRTLNGDTDFFEFENMAGERCFFAKSSISQVEPTDIPKVKKLDSGTDSDEEFNPFRILKISPQSDSAAIQTAYYARAKLYHPDRFSGADLPDEMARYADNMSRLINAAFQVLNKQNKQPVQSVETARPVQTVNL